MTLATMLPAAEAGDVPADPGLTSNLERSEAQAVPNPKAPARPAKSNPTGVAPAARRRTRIKHKRWEHAFDPLDLLDDLKGLIWSHTWRTPKYVVRFWWNRADWFAIPTIAAALYLAGAWPIGCALFALAGLWWRHGMTGRHLPPPITNRVELRERNAYQRKFRKLQPWRPKIVKGGIRHHPHKTVVECTYPADAKAPDVLNAVDYMQRVWGAGTLVEFPAGVVGRFRMVIPHDDILSHEPTRPGFEEVLSELGRYRLPVGLDKDGQIIWFDAVSQHLMLAGMTRKGKSTSLDSLREYAMECPWIEFRVWVSKPKDSRWFWSKAKIHTDTVEGTAKMLEEALAEVDRRNTEQPSGPYWPSKQYPLIIVDLDEYKSLFSGEASRDIERRCEAAAAGILRKGAGAGVCIWAATQDLHKTGINSELLGQFVHRLGFHVADTGQSMAIMDSRAPESDLSKIPVDQPGRAIWRGGIPTFQPCRTFRRLSSDSQPPDVFPPPVLQPPQTSPTFDSPESPYQPPIPLPVLPSQSHTGPNQTKPAPTSTELRALVEGKVRAAGHLGVMRAELVADLHETVHRVQYALEELRKLGRVECRGKRWFWIGVD